MKEISREGGPRASRRSNGEAARVVKRKPGMVRSKPKKTSYARRRRIAGIALIACFLLVVMVAFGFLTGGDEIGSGVSIGSVDVGGMTKEEAREAVQGDASATFRESPSVQAKRRSRSAATTSA